MDKLGYTVIQDWMYGLGLRLSETICLAVIFGFSQDEKGAFNGSRNYLAAKMCAKDVKTADAALKTLISLGYVQRQEVIRNNMKFPEYRVTELCLKRGMEITDRGVEKTDTPMEKTDTTKISTRKNKCNRDSFANKLRYL